MAFDPYRSWSPLTEEGYAEKLRLLREAASIPMERWRAPTVLAWIEIALGMPQYGARCAENVKSGKVCLFNQNIRKSIISISTMRFSFICVMFCYAWLVFLNDVHTKHQVLFRCINHFMLFDYNRLF